MSQVAVILVACSGFPVERMAARAVDLLGGDDLVLGVTGAGNGFLRINDARGVFSAAAATHVACKTQAGDRNSQDQDETQCDNLFHDSFLLFLSERSAADGPFLTEDANSGQKADS